MSSILKALRKLEDEKAALGEGRVDLARDILKRSAPVRNNSSALVLKIVFFGVLTIAVIAGGWLLLTPTAPSDVPSASETTQKPPVVVVEKQPIIDAPSLRNAKPSMEKRSSPQPPKATTYRKEEVITIAESAEVIPSQSGTVKSEKISVVVPIEPEVKVAEIEKIAVSEPVKPEPVASAEIPANVSTPVVPRIELTVTEQVFPAGVPALLVTAIAYKPAPGERLAVVNDLPVMEGTSIDGVQIVEILEDRVRFSWQEVEFILPLTEDLP